MSNATPCARGFTPRRAIGPGRARSHLENRPDGLIERRPLLDLVAYWAAFLAADAAETAYGRLRAGERTGRPLADSGLPPGSASQGLSELVAHAKIVHRR